MSPESLRQNYCAASRPSLEVDQNRVEEDIKFFELAFTNPFRYDSHYVADQLKTLKLATDVRINSTFTGQDVELVSKLLVILQKLDRFEELNDRERTELSSVVSNLLVSVNHKLEVYGSAVLEEDPDGERYGVLSTAIAALKGQQIALSEAQAWFNRREQDSSSLKPFGASVDYWSRNIKSQDDAIEAQKLAMHRQNALIKLLNELQNEEATDASGKDFYPSRFFDRTALLRKYERASFVFLKGNNVTLVRDDVAWDNVCGLSPSEIYALYNYTVIGYRDVNRALRSAGPEREKYWIYRETLNRALKKFKSFKGRVLRGTTLPDESRREHEVGKTIVYEAFTSTSLDNGFPGKDQFVINSRSGKFIAPFSKSPNEKEVLFAAGTRFKVISKTQAGEGTFRYILDEIGPSSDQDNHKAKKSRGPKTAALKAKTETKN